MISFCMTRPFFLLIKKLYEPSDSVPSWWQKHPSPSKVQTPSVMENPSRQSWHLSPAVFPLQELHTPVSGWHPPWQVDEQGKHWSESGEREKPGAHISHNRPRKFLGQSHCSTDVAGCCRPYVGRSTATDIRTSFILCQRVTARSV